MNWGCYYSVYFYLLLSFLTISVLYFLFHSFFSMESFFYFFLALGLSAFFWLPSAYYLNIVKVNYSNQNTGQLLNFIEPVSNLFRITVPYRGDDRYSILFILYYLILFIALKIKKGALLAIQTKQFAFFAIISIVGFVVLFKPAQALWEFTM